MSVNHLVYPLIDGYIHNWLVAGPHATAISDPRRSKEDQADDKLQTPPLLREQPAMAEPPVDQGAAVIDGFNLTWAYRKCHEDHFVDGSVYLQNWQHLQTWAYTEIQCKSPMPVTLVLTTSGPAEVWLNGRPIHRHEDSSQTLVRTPIQAALETENVLWVHFEQRAVRECENVMALQISGLPAGEAEAGISIRIPTIVRYPLRQQNLEKIFEYAYLEEVVNHRGAHFNLGWGEDLKQEITYVFKIMDEHNSVYLEGNWQTDPSKPTDVGHTYRLNERPYFVTLMAPLNEYFYQNLRYQRQLPIHVLDEAYSSAPYADLPQRRLEALDSATKYENQLFAEIAKMELQRWSDLNPKLMMQAIEQVNRRDSDSPILLAGLLGMLARYAGNPSFPKNLKQPIAACALNFKYWLDEPGQDALDYTCESHAILLHTCEILAGQLYPKRMFTNAQKNGLYHRKQGEQRALDWIRQRCGAGFADGSSNFTLEQVILALSSLTSLAKNDAVLELAAVLLDKTLFLLAVNSFKGACGSSHGRGHASMTKSAQLEATSGVSRLLWGMGVYNHHILGTVGLTCSNYEVPAFFAEIAADLPEELWSQEQQAMLSPGKEASVTSESGVNTVTYKTPDSMLSSAQDYRPGARGNQEHIWQATLGSDALVFTSHPACMSESEAHHPGFWLGNVVLPRVAQWKDVLIAVYNASEADGLGFTHAYFPTFAFDEHVFAGGWAFARKEKGYLALTAARGFELIKRGPDGYRELRSYGNQNIWICQMGREAVDGSFSDFQARVLEQPVSFQDQALQMTSLRGADLAFGWQGPLRVNGVEQSLSGFKHIENPYCVADLQAKYLDIRWRDIIMRLDFE